MTESLPIRILIFFLGLLLMVFPVEIHADQIKLSPEEKQSGELVQEIKQMTEKQMNDLFGEDPYLGQTSYLQSPEGFSQRQKSK